MSSNILFITDKQEDYLSDCVLHGLKVLYGDRVIDYPKKDSLYVSYPAHLQKQLYGRGFTLYRTLPDRDLDRSEITDKLRQKAFDIVIIGAIWRSYQWFFDNEVHLSRNRTIVLDGEDSPSIFPYNRSFFRKRRLLRGTKIIDQYLYFKRELIAGQSMSRWWQEILPEKYRRLPPRLQAISFGIPEEKIVSQLLPKRKEFPSHVVDSELSRSLTDADTQYRFDTEQDYYRDLQISRFGITTKRAGWDCLRHYEIAANGAVPCFRSLTEKPLTCAPHGLDENNSISYLNAKDLHEKIFRIGSAQYNRLQRGALEWARANTTKRVAMRMMETAVNELGLPSTTIVSEEFIN